MEIIKRPRWTDAGEKCFRDQYDCGGGAPKHIARTCCEVSALYNGKQINGQTVVNPKAVIDGLDAYYAFHSGEQPFEELGIIIEDTCPYRALLSEDSSGVIIFTEVYRQGKWERETTRKRYLPGESK